MFIIGEFAKVTGLTVKALRFYHQEGLLLPSYVETGTGYRYDAASKLDLARVIKSLRELEFWLIQIREIVQHSDDDSDLLEQFALRKIELQKRMDQDRNLMKMLSTIIQQESEAKEKMSQASS